MSYTFSVFWNTYWSFWLKFNHTLFWTYGLTRQRQTSPPPQKKFKALCLVKLQEVKKPFINQGEMIKAQTNVNRPLTGFLAVFNDPVCVFCAEIFPSHLQYLRFLMNQYLLFLSSFSDSSLSFTFWGLIASCSRQLLLWQKQKW